MRAVIYHFAFVNRYSLHPQMLQTPGDCTALHTMSNGLAASNNQPAKTYAITKLQYFATQRLRCKVNYTQQAELSFCVYAGCQRHSSWCLVSNFTYTYNASDYAVSLFYAQQLGVRK